jgi:dTMP kinase
MKNIFIVLEGLSGSGKTTVGKIVAQKLKAKFVKTPTPLFEPARKTIDKKADITARFLFYLASVVQASAEINLILKKRSVVCDRYLLTTLCWYRAIGGNIPIPKRLLRLITQPDHTILITCKNDIRLKRLRRRGLSHNDRLERRHGVENKFLREYMKHIFVEADNSKDNPRTTANDILEFLGK